MSPTTHDQRLRALQRSHEVRHARAELKERIATGEVFAASVILDPPDELRTMPIANLVMTHPGIGNAKMRKLLARLGVPLLKPTGELTDRQRERIAKALGNGVKR